MPRQGEGAAEDSNKFLRSQHEELNIITIIFHHHPNHDFEGVRCSRNLTHQRLLLVCASPNRNILNKEVMLLTDSARRDELTWSTGDVVMW